MGMSGLPSTSMGRRKKYDARFPPARIKKVMQKDDQIGKMASAVPVMIERSMELFLKDLLTKATQSMSGKTLTPAAIKWCVQSNPEFGFLLPTVASIVDPPTTPVCGVMPPMGPFCADTIGPVEPNCGNGRPGPSSSRADEPAVSNDSYHPGSAASIAQLHARQYFFANLPASTSGSPNSSSLEAPSGFSQQDRTANLICNSPFGSKQHFLPPTASTRGQSMPPDPYSHYCPSSSSTAPFSCSASAISIHQQQLSHLATLSAASASGSTSAGCSDLPSTSSVLPLSTPFVSPYAAQQPASLSAVSPFMNPWFPVFPPSSTGMSSRGLDHFGLSPYGSCAGATGSKSLINNCNAAGIIDKDNLSSAFLFPSPLLGRPLDDLSASLSSPFSMQHIEQLQQHLQLQSQLNQHYQNSSASSSPGGGFSFIHGQEPASSVEDRLPSNQLVSRDGCSDVVTSSSVGNDADRGKQIHESGALKEPPKKRGRKRKIPLESKIEVNHPADGSEESAHTSAPLDLSLGRRRLSDNNTPDTKSGMVHPSDPLQAAPNSRDQSYLGCASKNEYSNRLKYETSDEPMANQDQRKCYVLGNGDHIAATPINTNVARPSMDKAQSPALELNQYSQALERSETVIKANPLPTLGEH